MNQQDKPDSDTGVDRKEGLTTADLAGGEAATIDRPKAASDQSPSDEHKEPLFPTKDATELRERWDAIQAGFVDEPRKAVEAADSLVASAMKRLAETFANERAGLEAQWDRGDDVSTEDLRIALRRYRSFFDRLLSM